MLTPAQKRLIRDSDPNSGYTVNFFGVPQKTIAKLEDLGLVEQTSTYSLEEKYAIRQEVDVLVQGLSKALIDARDKDAVDYARNIDHRVRKLLSKKYVLTQKGKRIRGEALAELSSGTN